MKHDKLVCLLIILILTSLSFGIEKRPILISPFLDLSYDVKSDNRYYYPYDYYSNNDWNLCFGVNIYRKPLYLQLQLANYLQKFNNNGDLFGIAKVGMTEEVYKNGYVDMNFSYTDNLESYYKYRAYSGSVGYYHLFFPVDTLTTSYFSFGINLGFVNYNHWYRDRWGLTWYRYPENQTDVSALAEFSWINKYLRPYIAFGLRNLMNDDYNIYPRNSGFFSIGIQAQVTNILPYFSGSQTKLTYDKRNHYNWRDVEALKPNIYLYPETTIQTKVILIPQKDNEITISIPPYNNGWNVITEPSGLIDNKYEYLFYEGSRIRYQPSEFGWSVPVSELWRFLPENMAEYGFNEKEIKDFVDYWQEHLPKSNFYDIIPLINQEIEKEFALVIDPKPDAVLRVWFYINPTEKPNKLTPPSISKFERKGFAVVEWGVLLR